MNYKCTNHFLEKEEIKWCDGLMIMDPDTANKETNKVKYKCDTCSLEETKRLDRTIFHIPSENMSFVENKLSKLNKRAAKLGLEPVSLEVLETYFMIKGEFSSIKIEDSSCEPTIARKYLKIKVVGQAPKINGWSFVAKIEHTEFGNIISANPRYEEDIPVKYQKASNNCEHCNHKRFRKHIFILVNEVGDFIQVGRSCLKDFLGHRSPEAIAAFAEQVFELDFSDQEVSSGNSWEQYFDLKTVLEWSASIIRKMGFSGANSYQTRTSEHVSYITTTERSKLSGDSAAEYDRFKRDHLPTDKDKDLAQKTFDWILSFEDQDKTNYINNLLVLFKAGCIRRKDYGIAVSSVWVYMKEVEKAQIDKKETKEKANNHVGTIKERKEYDLKLVSSRAFQGDFDSYFVHSFEDREGNLFVWFTGKDAPVDETEEFHSFKATIKRHDMYKDRKQNVITRVSLV